MLKKCFLLAVVVLVNQGWTDPLRIVAAENFYGDLAKQIGGPYVEVVSIMSNPNQDPHLFSSSTATGQAIAQANMLVYNGIGYDSWIINLIKANSGKKKPTLIIADLIGKKMGDNPHIWYSPKTMPVYTKALTAKLSELDPDNKDYYDQQFQIFNDDFVALTDLIAEIKKNHSGSVLIGTEPVFNYMSDALGMKMVGLGFQLSIMNDTEPSSKDVAYFEAQLTNHTAKVLIYNAQVSNPMTERMQNLAIAQGIPIVGVTETQPPGKTYLEWMRSQLNDLKEALSQE